MKTRIAPFEIKSPAPNTPSHPSREIRRCVKIFFTEKMRAAARICALRRDAAWFCKVTSIFLNNPCYNFTRNDDQSRSVQKFTKFVWFRFVSRGFASRSEPETSD